MGGFPVFFFSGWDPFRSPVEQQARRMERDGRDCRTGKITLEESVGGYHGERESYHDVQSTHIAARKASLEL